jgi:fibronectin type 3 domain-containing protein
MINLTSRKRLIITMLHFAAAVTLLFSCGKITAPADIAAPATPANFSLLGGGDGQVSFRWAANREPDFDKYFIYRAVDSPADFIKIAETTETEFIDQFLDYDRVYYYYITAIDFAGNESTPTTTIDVRPINISSPTNPTNVVVFGHNYPDLNQIEFVITWTPPSISDLWKYLIYRGAEPGFEVSANSLLDSTSVGIFYDRTAQVNDLFYYRIVSVDLGWKTSLPSAATSDRILQKVDLISPSNRVQITPPFQFTWKSTEHAVAYQVVVAKSPLSDIIWSSAKVKNTEITYTGPALEAGSLYYWWVGAFSKDPFLNDDGKMVTPDVNSRSDIRTFFVR